MSKHQPDPKTEDDGGGVIIIFRPLVRAMKSFWGWLWNSAP